MVPCTQPCLLNFELSTLDTSGPPHKPSSHAPVVFLSFFLCFWHDDGQSGWPAGSAMLAHSFHASFYGSRALKIARDIRDVRTCISPRPLGGLWRPPILLQMRALRAENGLEQISPS